MKHKVWLGSLIALYGIVFSVIGSLEFKNFHYYAYDFGIHIQAIWKLAQGEGFFNTVRGMNIFGDHLWFINFLIAPLYRIFETPVFLLALQSFILAIGAWPLYRLAEDKINNRIFSLIISIAWLLSPALQNMNLEQFHPEVFATSFLMFAIEAANRKSRKAYAIWIALSLLCKEDVSLTVGALGLYLWLSEKQRRVGIVTIVVSIFWFVLCMKIFLPMFNGQGFFRFTGGYWFSNFWAGKFDPMFYWQSFANLKVLSYFGALLLPLLLLPLLGWRILVVAFPAIFINVVSKNDYLISINYHYVYGILAPLFVATVFGFQKIKDYKFAKYFHLVLLAVTLVSNHTLSRMSLVKIPRSISSLFHHWQNSEFIRSFEKLEAHIPKDAVVAATQEFVPALSQRNYVYMFPNPFQVSYWGMDGENPHDPKTVQWLLVREGIVERKEFPQAWHAVEEEFVLRASESGIHLYERKSLPTN